MDFRAHASSFGAVAELYDRIRPRYPTDALRWALGATPLRVVDLGAGTGILTRQLVELGHEVIAVEPDDQMRAHIGDRAEPGDAEHIPLADHTVDAVVAGTAYHWFATDAAHAEMARVLRPGGVFAPIWNVRDEEHAWVAALGRLLHGDANNTAPLDERRLLPDAFGPLFGPAERATFAWHAAHTVDSLVELVKSRSYYLVAAEPERHRMEQRVRQLLTTHPDLAGRAEIELPYVVYAYRAIRRQP